MNKHILVYSLNGCPTCATLLKELDSSNVIYEKHVCEDVSDECDDLEDYVGCSSYPIVVETTLPEIKKAYHCVKKTAGGAQRKTTSLSETDTLHVYFSLKSLIDTLITNK